MPETFDPYYKWLGIPPKDQPPHHYRLLGLDLFESDPEVIEAAANRQMTYIQGCATGPYVALSQKLLNEIAQARLTLLDTGRKPAYDKQLRSRLRAAEEPKAPVAARPRMAEPLRSAPVRAAGQPPASGPAPVEPAIAPVIVPAPAVAPVSGPAPASPPGPPGSPVVTPVGRQASAPAMGPAASFDVRAPHSGMATGRGRSRVRFDWRFPIFLIVAIGLVIAGIVIAQKLPGWLEMPPSNPTGQTTGAPARSP